MRTARSTFAASSSHASDPSSSCAFRAATSPSASSTRSEPGTSCSVDAAALETREETDEFAAVELGLEFELELDSDTSEGVELRARECASA
jgi:hypothetical protein